MSATHKWSGEEQSTGLQVRQTHSWAAFCWSAVLGFGVWLFSPYFTGKIEPWDSESSYFVVSLILAGAGAGLIRPRQIIIWPAGVFSGQFIAILVRNFTQPAAGASFLFLGVFFLAGYSLLSLLGAVPVASVVTWLHRRRWQRRESKITQAKAGDESQ